MKTGKVILVVEDDLDVREGLVQVLQFEGYQAIGAENGLEALEHLRRSPRPDLILLDLMMPVMDGWQFRDAQRQDPSFARIPVVVISAGGRVEQKASALGADAYLLKPIDVDALLAVIERFG